MSLLTSHLETQHDVHHSFVLNRDLTETEEEETTADGEPRVYMATFSYTSNWFECPVPGCTGAPTTKWNLRGHFLDRHPNNLVNIPGVGVYRRCGLCCMQVSPLASSHKKTQHFKEVQARIVQKKAAMNAARAQEETFCAYGVELDQVDVFKYMVKLLASNGNDSQAMRSNLKKAQRCWSRISRVF